MTDVMVPALGESVSEATVSTWFKKPGDAVKQDEMLCELETDKVSVEVPSPVAGVMGQQVVKVGDTVNVGAVIASIEAGSGAVAEAAQGTTEAAPPQEAPIALKAEATPQQADAMPKSEAPPQAQTLSPSVRRLVLEKGVDPTSIKGSGKDGRLTKDDVVAAGVARKAEAPVPALAPLHSPTVAVAAVVAAPSGARTEERVRISRLRQTIATRLKEAQNTAALLTTFNDVDMTAVIEARTKYKDLFEKKHGVRLGFMGFFVKAACMALRDIPNVNAQIDGEEIVYHDYVDISVAVSAPNGLVVPVIRDAQSLSVAGIEKTIDTDDTVGRDRHCSVSLHSSARSSMSSLLVKISPSRVSISITPLRPIYSRCALT